LEHITHGYGALLYYTVCQADGKVSCLQNLPLLNNFTGTKAARIIDVREELGRTSEKGVGTSSCQEE
jgi:hypothetical protein